MTAQPMVSAIVANWNGAKDLEICLPSLLAQSYSHLEIIVADNASKDDSAAVAHRFGVTWLGLERNKGLAGALNEGAKAAQGELVLFLNNDMRFHEKFVEFMVAEIVRDPGIFSVDALQYDWEGGRMVHMATSLARKRVEKVDEELLPGLFVRQVAQSNPTTVLMSSAANMLVRRSLFQELGGFDERLPIGYEDVELCWRAWVRGWKTVFAPDAVCWHRIAWSARSKEGSGMRFRGTIAGRILMATKLLPFRFVLAAWGTSLAGLARDLLVMRWQRVRERLAVLKECVRNHETSLRERRAIYQLGNISPSKHLERLLRLDAH
jgi:GT2 family glycosyltransferase